MGFVSIEKYLGESWAYCLFLGEKDARKISKEDVESWWNFQLKRFEDKLISRETLRKYAECIVGFYQFLENLPLKKTPQRFEWIQLPKKPRPQLEQSLPSQADVKKLIEAVFLDGKRYSIRDQAILALLNDTGCRIGEALSIRNGHIREEGNYLVVSFPESKSMPRTVISFLAKQFLENWAKVSPNKSAGPDAFFFCQANGSSCSYAAVIKSFKRALQISGLSWKKGKSVHYFRSICSSRFFNWPYTLKHAWFGWVFRDHEAAYTRISHQQFVEVYFETLKKENNPFLSEELPFWSEEKIDQALIEKLLQQDEFRAMVRRMVRQAGNKF
ncbi:MAG: site-specific integrase [Candidatus Diapherotrites archaeon]|nr:site-specific integrase [Candidatus Diapherotrites archaeon]